MVDMRFDSCFLLAENFPDAWGWPSFPREGRRPNFLILARLRQRYFWLAIRSGTLQRVCVPSWNSSTTCSSSNKQQKKQAASASSSCRTSPADMAHAGMAPCRRLTQTDLASCSLSYLHNHQASSAVSAPRKRPRFNRAKVSQRRRSGAGGVLCTDPANAAAAAAAASAAAASAAASKRNALLQASTAACRCMVLLLQARVPSAPRF